MAVVTEALWDELRTNLRGFIGRRVRSAEDVDDLVQRVLLQIHRGLGSLRDDERLHAWVYRTARNAITDYYRSPTHRRELPSGDAADLMADAPAGDTRLPPEDEAVALRDLAGCIAPLLRQLPAASQEALTLADLEGLSQADAARRTGVSVSGMKSRVQRGRKQLKAILQQCCRIEMDRRGGIMAYDVRKPAPCDPCGDCGTSQRAPYGDVRPPSR